MMKFCFRRNKMKQFLIGMLIFVIGLGMLFLILLIPDTQLILAGISGWIMGIGVIVILDHIFGRL